MVSNWVYIVSNDYPICKEETIYKIGCTTKKDYHERIDSLYNTSVPYPFQKVMVFNTGTTHCRIYEQMLHGMFQKARISEDREFFKLTPKDIARIYKVITDEDDCTVEYISTDYLCKYYEGVIAFYENWICNALCIDYDDDCISRENLDTIMLQDIIGWIDLRCEDEGDVGRLIVPDYPDFTTYIIKNFDQLVVDEQWAEDYLKRINERNNMEESYGD